MNFPITPRSSYLRFLAKQPQFVLGSAHGVFGVGSWSCSAAVLLPVSFRCVANGPVRTGSAQILAEVLEREVSRRVKAGLKRLHHDDRVLGESEDSEQLMERRSGEAIQPPGLR